MEELASGAYDALSEAIDECDKDLAFNPRKFLGFALYPESLWTTFTFLGTIGFGLLQQQIFSK